MISIDIRRAVNIGAKWLMESIMTWKLLYFSHVRRRSGIERTVMEDVVPGKRGGGATNAMVDTGH